MSWQLYSYPRKARGIKYGGRHGPFGYPCLGFPSFAGVCSPGFSLASCNQLHLTQVSGLASPRIPTETLAFCPPRGLKRVLAPWDSPQIAIAGMLGGFLMSSRGPCRGATGNCYKWPAHLGPPYTAWAASPLSTGQLSEPHRARRPVMALVSALMKLLSL